MAAVTTCPTTAAEPAVCHHRTVHLVPADRLSRRILDGELVCEALSAIGDSGDIAAWAQRFKLLSEPSRLTLLLCIHRAGPISVTDLAVAADMNDTTVSQALRLLRAAGTVEAHRDGRIVRYDLADPRVGALLDQVAPRAAHNTRQHHPAH
jgi:DNA-binding transcriptional ArsR family regulator